MLLSSNFEGAGATDFFFHYYYYYFPTYNYPCSSFWVTKKERTVHGVFLQFFFNARIQLTVFIDFHRNLCIELTGNHNLVIINRDTAKQFMVYCFQFYCNFSLNQHGTQKVYIFARCCLSSQKVTWGPTRRPNGLFGHHTLALLLNTIEPFISNYKCL